MISVQTLTKTYIRPNWEPSFFFDKKPFVYRTITIINNFSKKIRIVFNYIKKKVQVIGIKKTILNNAGREMIVNPLNSWIPTVPALMFAYRED